MNFKSACLIAMSVSIAVCAASAEPWKNCLVANNAKGCAICIKDHFLNTSNVCEAVKTKVANCMVYKADGDCEGCEVGYRTSTKKNANTYECV